MDRERAGSSTGTRHAFNNPPPLNRVDEPQRVNGVSAYTNDIDKALEEVHVCLGALISRIEPILRPVPPDGGANVASSASSMESPLSERQVAHKAAIALLYDRIDATIQRVDL